MSVTMEKQCTKNRHPRKDASEGRAVNGHFVNDASVIMHTSTRALLKNATIVLLDEATASPDVENETKVQDTLSALLQNKTVLVIAHRMRTVQAADQIIVLKDGRVVEAGKPEDLMKQNGEFLKMVTSGSKAPSERLGER